MRETLQALPWPVVAALCTLTLTAAVAVVLLVKMALESAERERAADHWRETAGACLPENWPSREDDGEVLEVPLYPPPPAHITSFGIHKRHIDKGHETEKGCPVCIRIGLHLDRIRRETKARGVE